MFCVQMPNHKIHNEIKFPQTGKWQHLPATTIESQQCKTNVRDREKGEKKHHERSYDTINFIYARCTQFIY